MSHVLTLVASALRPDHIEAARALLPAVGDTDWLADGIACDLRCGDLDVKATSARLREEFAGRKIDFALQPDGPARRRRLLIADMDSTIITVECIDEMADMLGLKERVAAITERAMRGEIDFPAALRERAGLLRGLPLAALETVYRDRIRLMPGARTLVQTMRASGAAAALVSGGFTFFTEKVAADAGFDSQQANRLIIEHGALSGEVAEPILDADAKLSRLRELVADLGLSPGDVLAVGDGANDVPMLRAAGLGVAYHAKPVTAAAAAARVDHGDLTTLLYYQGYRRSEFAPG